MAQNMVNGKVYIGQTVRSLKERMGKHLYDGLIAKKNNYFYNALRKYGKDNFSWNVLCECSSVNELNQKEIELIAEHRSTERDFGYNLKSGGLGGHHANETKEKIRIANTGYKHSDVAKKKMSVAKSGDGNPNFGKSHSEEWKEKISKSHTGFKHTQESIEKIRQKKIGFKHTEETKKKIGLFFRGKSLTEDHRKKLSEFQRSVNGKSVLALDKKTGITVKSFECVSDAVKEFGEGNRPSIFRALSGSRKSACGFVWRYADKERSIEDKNQ